MGMLLGTLSLLTFTTVRPDLKPRPLPKMYVYLAYILFWSSLIGYLLMVLLLLFLRWQHSAFGGLTPKGGA